MIKNYLKIALRNLKRHKGYMAINVMGLGLGMACAIMIFSLVKYHLGFDKFHKDSDRIYRFVTEQHRDVVSYTHSVPNPFGKAFRDDYTYGEKVARIARFDGELVTVIKGNGPEKFNESEVAFVEPEFFDIFNYPLISGDKKSVLTAPNTAIITEKVAHKYFGNDNPIGKTFRLDNRLDFQVTGILKDIPENTDMQTEIYLSYISVKDYDEDYFKDDTWGGISSSMQAFVKLRPGVSPTEVEKVLPAYVTKYRPKSKNVHQYKLQPLRDIHFDGRYGGIMEKRNLWVLSFIGLFLVITACVNFVNLATAQALNRSREIGVRKVLGGLRSQLFWQFIAETAVITFLALALAMVLAALAMPTVNEWFNATIHLNFTNPLLLVFIATLMLLVTFLAGSYPGLVLAGFQPVLALKAKLTQKHIGGFNTRRVLIVTQFAISQVLVIGMIVIVKQMQYAKQSDLGFNKSGIIMVPMGTDPTKEKAVTLKNQFAQIPGVENVSACYTSPASSNSTSTNFRYDNRSEDETFKVSLRSADDQFLSLFDLKLVAGRNFFPSDSARELVVNETMARKLNLRSPAELIGHTLSADGGDIKGTIVGVVKDFHDRSFHADISAILITNVKENYADYAIKINLARIKETTTAIEKLWTTTFPEQIYRSSFFDDNIEAFYTTEELMLKMIRIFSLIAIFIGCLGLYGMVSFMATQKTKEIGIRKVLGSSIGGIIWMFGKEFFRLVVIAFVIAAPIGWWAMNAWLEDFPFRITISPWIFILSILVTVVVMMLTVGYRSIRAAIANPVKSLRAE